MEKVDAPPRAVEKIERPKQRARTRARIKKAARELFAGGGYLTCSVADIVHSAGVSRAVFYLHFQDKEELLGEVITDSVTAHRRFLDTIALRADPSDADLTQWIDRYVTALVRSMDSVRLVNLAGFVNPALARTPYVAQTEGVLKIAHRNPAFRIIDDRGEVRMDRLIQLHLLIFSLGQVALAIGHDGWDIDRAQTVEMLVRQFRRFIDSDPADG